jgi:hypothetical protein
MRAPALPLIGVAFLCAGVTPVILSAKAVAEAVAPRNEPMTEDEVKLRGEQLRAGINATYKLLRASNSLRTALRGGNDVTAIVLKYIPAGTSLKDARAILQAAGYMVGPLQQGHVVSRTILRGGLFEFYGCELSVDIAPQATGDFSTVSEVRAIIFARYVPNADRR